jgi:hypothetical protein
MIAAAYLYDRFRTPEIDLRAPPASERCQDRVERNA